MSRKSQQKDHPKDRQKSSLKSVISLDATQPPATNLFSKELHLTQKGTAGLKIHDFFFVFFLGFLVKTKQKIKSKSMTFFTQVFSGSFQKGMLGKGLLSQRRNQLKTSKVYTINLSSFYLRLCKLRKKYKVVFSCRYLHLPQFIAICYFTSNYILKLNKYITRKNIYWVL